MRYFLVLLFCLLAAPAGATPLDPAIGQSVVRIEIDVGNRDGDCTGVLVAPDVVATAAHCAQNEPPSAMRFWIAGQDAGKGLEFIARGATLVGQTGDAAIARKTGCSCASPR